MKGNYESENPYATGRIVIGTKPTITEFLKFTSKVDHAVLDLVIEYLDAKGCLNDDGIKLSTQFYKKYKREEKKMPKKKVSRTTKKKVVKKKAAKKKPTRKKRDTTSQIMDVLGSPSGLKKQMRNIGI